MTPDKTSPDRIFCKECRLMIWRPRGVLDDDLADEIVTHIEAEELSESQPFNRFADLSSLDEIRLHFGHIFKIVQRRRAFTGDVPPVKSALYAETMVGFGIARMYETLMEPSTIDVRAFRDREEAARWLEVPLQALVAEGR